MKSVNWSAVLLGAVGMPLAFFVGGSVSAEPMAERQVAAPDTAGSEPMLAALERLSQSFDRFADRYEEVSRVPPAASERVDVAAVPAGSAGGDERPDEDLTEAVRGLTGDVSRLVAAVASSSIAGPVELTPRGGPRVAAIERAIAEFPEVVNNNSGLPIEIAVMGVHEIIERFGWPDSASCPRSPGSLFELTYEEALVGSSIQELTIHCTLDQTFNFYASAEE